MFAYLPRQCYVILIRVGGAEKPPLQAATAIMANHSGGVRRAGGARCVSDVHAIGYTTVACVWKSANVYDDPNRKETSMSTTTGTLSEYAPGPGNGFDGRPASEGERCFAELSRSTLCAAS